jgi:hypothetical protein
MSKRYTLKKRGGATNETIFNDPELIKIFREKNKEINISNIFIEIQKYIGNNDIDTNIYNKYIHSKGKDNNLNNFDSKKSIDSLFFVIYFICRQYVTFQLDTSLVSTSVTQTDSPERSDSSSFSDTQVTYGAIDINNIVNRTPINIETIIQIKNSYINYNNLIIINLTKTTYMQYIRQFIMYIIETKESKLYNDLFLLYYCCIILNTNVYTTPYVHTLTHTAKKGKPKYNKGLQLIFDDFNNSILLTNYVIKTFNILIKQIHNDLIYTFSPYNIFNKYLNEVVTEKIINNIGIMQICILLYSNNYTPLQTQILRINLKEENTFLKLLKLNFIMDETASSLIKGDTHFDKIKFMIPIQNYMEFLLKIGLKLEPLITKYHGFLNKEQYLELAQTIDRLYGLGINFEELNV